MERGYSLAKKHKVLYEWKINAIKKARLQREKFQLIPHDVLTVGVEVTVYDDCTTITTSVSFKNIKSQMAHQCGELYNSKIGSDVVVEVGDKEFPAHKIILMARSPVLAAMFSHEMIEKKDNKLTIIDISPKIFEKVLEYIYTDEVTHLDDDAHYLLEAADKYQLETLKQMCQNSLSKSLTAENSFYVMTLADRHNAKELLEYVSEFVVINAEEIIETKTFKELEKSKSSLNLMLFKKFTMLNLAKNETKITHSS
ncbi:speckle-type POZ protein-like [Microplitis mediator]|uniref:speckle-type POZ protein-like n=1 Tax=Microplitis mediator TaxID=375433 RepID=UPI002555FEBB|nr:speckle-type POZ protein-like [Microplitis mediator]